MTPEPSATSFSDKNTRKRLTNLWKFRPFSPLQGKHGYVNSREEVSQDRVWKRGFKLRYIESLTHRVFPQNPHATNGTSVTDRVVLLYASTRIKFHFVLRHSRHHSVTTVSLSYVPFIIVYYRLSVFRLSSFSSLQIYSAPVMFRAPFLGFVAALSYFNIFTFLWLDNKFIVFVILWLNYLVVLRHFT